MTDREGIKGVGDTLHRLGTPPMGWGHLQWVGDTSIGRQGLKRVEGPPVGRGSRRTPPMNGGHLQRLGDRPRAWEMGILPMGPPMNGRWAPPVGWGRPQWVGDASIGREGIKRVGDTLHRLGTPSMGWGHLH